MDFDALFAKRALHIKPGLERIRASYEYLGRPGSTIPSVLIGGTNGKGSTSGFIWSLLAQNQGEFGLYSSPHLVNFSERFQLARQPCDDAEIAELLQQLQQTLPPALYEELSFFEAATILAFQLFAARQSQMNVLEVGLGGRWDATNISDPLVSVLVSVSQDHGEYLGFDLKNIFQEKLGIMREGRPLFWGDGGEICAVPEYRELIAKQAKKLRAPVYIAKEHFYIDHQLLCIELPNLPKLRLPLFGLWSQQPEFMQRNLTLAVAVYHYLSIAKSKLRLRPLEAIWESFTAGNWTSPVTFVGRCQKLRAPAARERQKLIIDVCHNPDGARTFIASLQELQPQRRCPALLCILRDKDLNSILDVLRSELHPVILFGINHARAWEPSDLAERHRDLSFFADFDAAWAAMRERAGADTETPWIICGSVLAVGEVLKKLAVSPKDLHVARVIGGDWS